MHLSEHTPLGFGSCGIITTFSNVNLQSTREPMVLPCWYWKSNTRTQWGSWEMLSFSGVFSQGRGIIFLVPQGDGRWEGFWMKWPLHPRCRFDSCQLHLVINTCVWVFCGKMLQLQVVQGIFLLLLEGWQTCCYCDWVFQRVCWDSNLVKLLCLEHPHFSFGGYGSGALVKGTASHLGVGPALLKGRNLCG